MHRFSIADKPSRLNQKKRAPDENTRANMKQYGYESQYMDVIVADSSLPLWRSPSFFDAIVTDRKQFSLIYRVFFGVYILLLKKYSITSIIIYITACLVKF